MSMGVTTQLHTIMYFMILYFYYLSVVLSSERLCVVEVFLNLVSDTYLN